MVNAPRRIFLMRHAEPENPSGVMYGNLPGFPLNEFGRRQATEAGKWLASQTKIDYIICSPRERTHQTADIVAKLNPARPSITLDERLRDIDISSLEGKITAKEWDKRRQKFWQMRSAGIDGLEPPLATQARIVEVFREMTDHYSTGNLLFVSHADPLAFLSQALLQRPIMSSKQLTGAEHFDKSSIFEIILQPHVIIKKVFQPTKL